MIFSLWRQALKQLWPPCGSVSDQKGQKMDHSFTPNTYNCQEQYFGPSASSSGSLWLTRTLCLFPSWLVSCSVSSLSCALAFRGFKTSSAQISLTWWLRPADWHLVVSLMQTRLHSSQWKAHVRMEGSCWWNMKHRWVNSALCVITASVFHLRLTQRYHTFLITSSQCFHVCF